MPRPPHHPTFVVPDSCKSPAEGIRPGPAEHHRLRARTARVRAESRDPARQLGALAPDRGGLGSPAAPRAVPRLARIRPAPVLGGEGIRRPRLRGRRVHHAVPRPKTCPRGVLRRGKRLQPRPRRSPSKGRWRTDHFRARRPHRSPRTPRTSPPSPRRAPSVPAPIARLPRSSGRDAHQRIVSPTSWRQGNRPAPARGLHHPGAQSPPHRRVLDRARPPRRPQRSGSAHGAPRVRWGVAASLGRGARLRGSSLRTARPLAGEGQRRRIARPTPSTEPDAARPPLARARRTKARSDRPRARVRRCLLLLPCVPARGGLHPHRVLAANDRSPVPPCLRDRLADTATGHLSVGHPELDAAARRAY